MHWTVHLEGGPRRVNHAAAAVGDVVYTFGGYCTGEIETYRQEKPIDVHTLNTVNLQWKHLPKPLPKCKQYFVTPYQRYGHSAVTYGKNIYIWGGRNDQVSCNKLFCFDTETYLWSCPATSGSIPCSRDGHSACVIGHNMYIFGGFEEEFEIYSQDVYVLNLQTFHWSFVLTQGPPPEYRDFHTATAIGNRMYIFGGRSDWIGPHSSDDDFYPNQIMYLNTSTMQWHKPKTFGECPVGRRSHSAFVYDGDLYIFGGYNGVFCQHFNDLHKFCPRTQTWSEVFTLGIPPKKRRRQVCIVIGDRMYLFGGTR
ncbi:hypothetical protein AAG570_006759 [Ranatra chinensis]|uniref:Kelch domain-containing protein 3 n=1 Tax=Ranatra chinensis TaxID=642074 RepID=A0ABD0Z5J1_9HEMI